MATTAHCLYCFDVLASHFEQRPPLKLNQIEHLWPQFEKGEPVPELQGADGDRGAAVPQVAALHEDDDDDDDDTRPMASTLRPRQLSRLQAPSPASASSSSTPSTLSATSLQIGASSNASNASSRTSFFSNSRNSPAQQPDDSYPLFVTWNTVSSRGHKSLRGCIGTFEAQELSVGLESYALASAFDDTRFAPIAHGELPALAASITLLTDFTPCADALDWDLGTHGIRLSFRHHGRRYGATYLPDVAVEQGWNKEETVVSLMRKAGWNGRSGDWARVADMQCVRYQGKKASVAYATWKEWRAWLEEATPVAPRAP